MKDIVTITHAFSKSAAYEFAINARQSVSCTDE